MLWLSLAQLWSISVIIFTAENGLDSSLTSGAGGSGQSVTHTKDPSMIQGTCPVLLWRSLVTAAS